MWTNEQLGLIIVSTRISKGRCCGNMKPKLKSLGWLLEGGEVSVDPED